MGPYPSRRCGANELAGEECARATCTGAAARCLAVAIVLAGPLACSSFRNGPLEDGGVASNASTLDAASANDAKRDPTDDGGDLDAGRGWDGLADASADGGYDAVQRDLEAKRFPGPMTAPNSMGTCTSKYFVWRDPDGTLHSWEGSSQARIDYGFTAVRRTFFGPSDTYILVDVPPLYASIAAYQTDAANALAATIDSAYDFIAASDGIVRLDQRIDGGAPLNGTQVRFWHAATNTTEDISTVLQTQLGPSSYGNDEVVIPADVNAPFPLFIVNIAKKTTTTVTFDGGMMIYQTISSPSGLLVAYVRNGANPAIRLYKGNEDNARVEIGDEISNRPPLLSDGPAAEHKFLSKIALYKNTLLYGSSFGIFAYDLATAALTPVQLAAGKVPLTVDTLCVLSDPGLVLYRLAGDTVGQTWAVPLGH